jgi:AmiR/NasT family two-component response regulator
MERDLGTRSQQASAVTDFVMIDLRDEPRLPVALEAFCRQHPGVPVFLLVSSLDPVLMLEAMRAGVKECLQYPFSAEDLGRVRRVAVARTQDRGLRVPQRQGRRRHTTATNVATKHRA